MSDFNFVYTGSNFILNQNDTFGLTVTANKKMQQTGWGMLKERTDIL